MKICARCEQLLPVEIFTPCAGRGDGYKSRCRPCREATRPRARESAQRMDRYHAAGAAAVERQRAYQAVHRETYRLASRKWRAANPDKQTAARQRWDRANSDKNAASAHRYYTRKRQRMPAWLTAEQIERIDNFYLLARLETGATGIKHHVDHIVPLHGATVCGLHVPWNLQVIPAAVNSAKGNRL